MRLLVVAGAVSLAACAVPAQEPEARSLTGLDLPAPELTPETHARLEAALARAQAA